MRDSLHLPPSFLLHRGKVTVDPRFSSDSLDIPKAEPVPPPGYYNARHSAKT